MKEEEGEDKDNLVQRRRSERKEKVANIFIKRKESIESEMRIK